MALGDGTQWLVNSGWQDWGLVVIHQIGMDEVGVSDAHGSVKMRGNDGN